MSDEQYTRCPGCRTVFRVTPQQLALKDGQVRCGHCRNVFDGRANAMSLAPMPRLEGDSHADDLAAGPPTVTLRNARALEPAAPAGATQAIPEPSFRAGIEAPAVDEEERHEFRRQRRRRERLQMIYAAAIPLLLLMLVFQALFHFRDALAARWPGAKPALAGLCAAVGCTIRPMRDVGVLSIDASDLQADPAHRGLLILTATVRNRGAVSLAYPYLELTLTDANDQVVVRKALAPAEYAGGTADLSTGIPANGEVLVRLFVDASATTQAGYRLYLFYP